MTAWTGNRRLRGPARVGAAVGALGLLLVTSGCRTRCKDYNQIQRMDAQKLDEALPRAANSHSKDKLRASSFAWSATYYDIAPLAGELAVKPGEIGLFDEESSGIYIEGRSSMYVNFWGKNDEYNVPVESCDNSNAFFFRVPNNVPDAYYYAYIYDSNSTNYSARNPFFVLKVDSTMNGVTTCP
jgi:hypothetical protein